MTSETVTAASGLLTDLQEGIETELATVLLDGGAFSPRALARRLLNGPVSAALASTARAAAGDWQPIETAPKDGTPIVGCAPDWQWAERFEFVCAGSSPMGWRGPSGRVADYRQPTLWKAWPNPPGQSPAVPASPRSGAGDGEETTGPFPVVGPAAMRNSAAVMNGLARQDPAPHAAAPTPTNWKTVTLSAAQSSAPAEHGVEIRERIASVLRAHMVQDSVHWWRTASLPELTDAILSALSQGGQAGGSDPAQSPSTSDGEG